MTKSCLTIFLTILPILLIAQKKSCELITKDGDTITGFIKNNERNYYGIRFKLYDTNDNFVKIKAKDFKSMTVNDTLNYRVFTTKNGWKSFMKEIVAGGKMSLYLDDPMVTARNMVAGQFETGVALEYYLLKKDKIHFIKSSKLKDFPERYFGGVPNLITEIRNTKKRFQKEKLKDWVEEYNREIEKR